MNSFSKNGLHNHDSGDAVNAGNGEQKRNAESSDITGMSVGFLKYLTEVTRDVFKQEQEINDLLSMIMSSGAVHVFGVGRSGAAAMAFAIRLRHFCDYLPDVWWVGDQVRMPIREHDLLIVFSKDGSRSELAAVAYNATQQGARIVLITANLNSRVGALARLKIVLPLSRLPICYGGGDFELAAFFFQELLITTIGKNLKIPEESVWKNHV